MRPRILVLGVGPQGPASLTPEWQARVAEADGIWAGKRLLALWALSLIHISEPTDS